MNCKLFRNGLLTLLLGAGALGGKVGANPVTIPDFSFELWTNAISGFPLADGANTGAPDVGPNWRAAGNGGVFLVNPLDAQFAGTTGTPGTLPASGDGANFVRIGLGKDGYCWQMIGTLQPSTIYTLTVAVGNTLLNDGGAGAITLLSGTFPGGTTLASAPVNSLSLTAGTFADSSVVFTTGQNASGPLTILLQGSGGTGTQIIYDNVRLDATPAPATPTALVPAAAPGTNVYVGTIVTLTEDPAGAGPFQYQWQSDNGSGGTAFSNLPGATSANLTVDTSGFSTSSMEYQVIVTSSQGTSTSAPVVLTAIQGAPVLLADTLPSSGSDVVGGRITFSANFDGTRPIYYQWEVQDTNGNPALDIVGATNSTLTLTNLQLSDYALYYLIASNAQGVAYSTPTVFAVNPLPPATNNMIIATANQTGPGGIAKFSPSWIVSLNNDLIANLLPSTVGPGAFNDPQEHIGGTPAVLTDGKVGTFYPEGVTSPDVVTGGIVSSGAGQYVIYTLPVIPGQFNGYDLTNIVTYGGWADAGRDEQRYVIYYSTVASPSNFTAFANVLFNPSDPAGVQSATRVSIIPSGAAPLVKNVAALKFDFSTLDNGAENGFVGYSEIQVFGIPSPNAPILASDTEPGSASDVVGSSITLAASFTGATGYQWMNISGGATNAVIGATNQTLTLTNLQTTDAGAYYVIATNASGSAVSSASTLTVNAAGNALISGAANLLASAANQTGRGTTYTPNWIVGTNGDLVLHASPTGIGSGVYNNENSGGISILTDGKFGSVGSGINTSLASVGQSAGTSLTYTLTGPSSGFDVTNIVTYGGWSDGGRDQQAFTVSYSTVLAPTTFISLGSVSFNPSLPGSVPSAVRLSLSSTSGPLATNVAKIQFNFASPGIENGWSGLAELGVFGSASAPIPLAPYVTSDVVPATGSGVVGSQAIFTAAFNGTAPISYQWLEISGGVTNPVAGATSPTLTINSLQSGNTGSYQLQASNAVGVSYSSQSSFTVNAVPSPNGNGVIVAPANQTGNGAFIPTWVVTSGSLIAGKTPSNTGSGGSFTADPGEGGLPVLTDGALNLFGASVAGLATCGSGNGGHSITYTLTGSATGYNLTNIVSYGGWADGGRDQQAYTVSYSTVASPAVFSTIAAVNYNPSLSGSVPSADRMSLTSSTGGFIATNVAAVKFDFTNPAGENGYSGYAEFQLFGASATPPTPPTMNAPLLVGGNLILTGTGGVAGTSYKVLTATDVTTPLSQWTTNTTGVFTGSGAFSNSIPVSGAEPARYFLLKTP